MFSNTVASDCRSHVVFQIILTHFIFLPENWPPDITKAILDDFDSENHDEQDPNFTTVGDRRQEIVFIGTGIDRRDNQVEISQTLDKCLLDDLEWSLYCKLRSDENSLQAKFRNPIQSTVVTY